MVSPLQPQKKDDRPAPLSPSLQKRYEKTINTSNISFFPGNYDLQSSGRGRVSPAINSLLTAILLDVMDLLPTLQVKPVFIYARLLYQNASMRRSLLAFFRDVLLVLTATTFDAFIAAGLNFFNSLLLSISSDLEDLIGCLQLVQIYRELLVRDRLLLVV